MNQNTLIEQSHHPGKYPFKSYEALLLSTQNLLCQIFSALTDSDLLSRFNSLYL